MSNPFFDDKAYIAEQFCLEDDYTAQSARFASHKINSFKLSLNKEAYCMSKADLNTYSERNPVELYPTLHYSFFARFFEEERNN